MRDDLTALVRKIKSARDCGVVRCGFSRSLNPTLEQLAAEFGLKTDPRTYHSVDATTASRIVTLVLERDLAYGTELIPRERAAVLAAEFLSTLDGPGVRYFTNGTLHESLPGVGGGSGRQWIPATTATFDWGILAIGDRVSGVLWVADED